MKAQNERRKTQHPYQSKNFSKIASSSRDVKLQFRQQQILNIVTNQSTSSEETKLKLLALRPVSDSTRGNTYSLFHNYKIKKSPINSVKISGALQKNVSMSKEKSNFLDKCSPSNSSEINTRQLSNEEAVVNKSDDTSEKKIDINLTESGQTNGALNESKETEEDIEINEVSAYAKLSQKDVIRQKIQQAIKESKIFLIRADIPYLDAVLKKRGWVKKYESTKTRHLAYGTFPSLEPTSSLGDIHYSDNTLNEAAFTYKELKHVIPDFIWDCRNDFVQWKGDIKSDTYLNRLDKSWMYTSKIELSLRLEEAYWYFEKGVSHVLFPRCYDISKDKNAFIQDYRQTAAVSYVRWFVHQVEENFNLLKNNFYTILAKPLKFAFERCEELLAFARDENLDNKNKEILSKDWDAFIDTYVNLVHEGGMRDAENIKRKINGDDREILKIHEKALYILEKIKYIDPQYELNGIRNIWILKPNMSCCGYGIIMSHKLINILAKAEEAYRSHFLVQKYIEKPLLIKNTKFDVRHWFLVTKTFPLTIWIYKESLLRFSSRPFTFDNYHEIIHICNTAVQRKYSDQKIPVRDLNWTCEMLNRHLKTIYTNYDCEPWWDIIYPKMCQAIVATTLAAQDRMDTRRNSFELYGADFVIMEDMSVWLIEINSNPRMHPPSTQITERLYPDVLESLIKVIFDYPRNNEADTGNFVLHYQQNIKPSAKLDQNLNLILRGHKITKNQIFLLDAELDKQNKKM